MTSAAEPAITEHDGSGTGTDCQGRKCRFDRLTCESLVGEQTIDGSFDEVTTGLGTDNDTGSYSSHFDLIGDQEHSVEQPETGVADIEDEAVIGKAGSGVHSGCCGRFHSITADGAMNEGTDGAWVQPGLLECESGGGDAGGSGERARVPPATFANAGPSSFDKTGS